MEEKLRQKDTVIEKLRLKNTTTKAYIAKMEQQLAHKEEMGEVLHLVRGGCFCVCEQMDKQFCSCTHAMHSNKPRQKLK